MKPEELRIGNWVEIEGRGIRKISGVKKDHVYTRIPNCERAELMSHIIMVKPIPLTPEWSEKFGYHEGRNDLFDFQVDMHIDIYEGVCYLICNGNVIKVIEEVHTLQNIVYALTGTYVLKSP